jgi:proteasome lid subunit RPN8/RPN11
VIAGNIAPEPTRYLIDPTDHFRILRETRHTGLTIVGAYHSHPASQPIPSPTDLAEALPNFVYLIATPRAGGSGSDVRAWCLDDGTDPVTPANGNFRELSIVLLP